jgi:four helix bundle protein
MKESVLRTKSFDFAVRIVKLARYLREKQKEFVLSDQILKSGTAIGALVREAEFAQSPADFISKMTIALKEAGETDYWISLLHATDCLETKLSQSLSSDCGELIAILVATVKTSKKRKPRNGNSKVNNE